MMRLKPWTAVLALVVGATISSCSSDSPLGPRSSPAPVTPHYAATQATALPDVRFSEIHYDNDGTDANERIEVSAPAGTDLTGWTVVLYNGSNGQSYSTTALDTLAPTACGDREVVVVDYPSNGIQNGSPDGMALVDASGTVVEFLSYEGMLTATDGPAAGLASTDIGASESGSSAADGSIQRDASGAWTAGNTNTFGTCNDDGPAPPVDEAPPVHVSELHYDNDGTDAGEAVEVEGPAGTDLTGWQIVLYNGNGGGTYTPTTTLSGSISATCGDRGVISVSISGIQNGPDGLALVDGSGKVVEFLSYEGSLTATDGPASGMTSADIGVQETSTTPVGQSLQRDAAGWYGPATASFGACNSRTAPPPPPPSDAPVIIDEILADPLHAESASWGEWFEVHNTGTEPIDLKGWTIASGGDASHTIASSVIVPAGGYAVLGRGYDPNRNGGITLDYNYYAGGSTIWLDDTDYLLLRDAAGALVDSVRWRSGSTMAKAASRALEDASTADADVDGAGWGYSTVTFGAGDFGTPSAPNGTLSDTPPHVPNYITFTGRTASDMPLPVGFEGQVFATLHDGSGATLPATFTWSSEAPAVATIDQDGVFHALAAGTAVLRATAADGTTATYALPTQVATFSGAPYGDNTEFGTPVDANPSDDYIVMRPEYTTSYNATRGTPNWVSYDLDASQITGAVDRCDCFTFDPELPTSFTHLTTADYTGAGAAAGYGIDRGHLARSFDRTVGTLDNATTFYLSNIIPQASDLNQGPWADLETYLGDLARYQDKEVYIIAGVAGSKGTVKDEGKITIPAQVWKVAVILPRDQGLDAVHAPGDAQVLAVIMPNDPGVRDVDWHTYQTTVDAVEALSGYDVLSKLPDDVEWPLEAGITTPENATAAQLLGVFSAGVQSLVDGGVLSTGEGDALAASLSAADASLARGNGQAARGQLGAFTNKVEAMVRSGRLPADEAESLTTLAGWVLGRIS